MTTMKVVTLDAYEQHGTALIAPDDTVWIAYCPRPWDLASILWWFFCPSDKKGFVTLTLRDNRRVRTKAIRVARRHVKIGAVEPRVGFQG